MPVFFGAVVFFGVIADLAAALPGFGPGFFAVIFFGAAFVAFVAFFATAFFGAAAFFTVFFAVVFFAVIAFLGAALAVAFFAGVFFAAVFLAAGFLAATAFFGAAFFAAGFFTAAFLTAGFLTAAFLTAGFLTAAFFAVGFFVAGFLPAAAFLGAAFLVVAFTAKAWAAIGLVSSLVTRLAPSLMGGRKIDMSRNFTPGAFDTGGRAKLPPPSRILGNALSPVLAPNEQMPLWQIPAEISVTVHDRPSFCVRCLLTDTVLTRLRRESRDARRIAIHLPRTCCQQKASCLTIIRSFFLIHMQKNKYSMSNALRDGEFSLRRSHDAMRNEIAEATKLPASATAARQANVEGDASPCNLRYTTSPCPREPRSGQSNGESHRAHG